MPKFRKIFTTIIVLVVTLIVIPSVLASHFISFTGPTIATCSLTSVSITGSFTFSAGGDADITYAETIDGSPIGSGDLADTGTFTSYNYDPFTAASFPYDFSAIWAVVSRSTGDTLEEYELSGTCTGADTGTVSFTFIAPPSTSTPETTSEDPSPRQVFFDGRINSFDTGNSVVLFGNPSNDNNWRLEVYGADGSGLLLLVPADAINAAPACPESNTLIHIDEETGISLWRLPERTVTAEGVRVCPFQLNAPSTETGKTYIIIFDTLYPNTYYESGDEWLGN